MGYRLIAHPIELIRCMLTAWELSSIDFFYLSVTDKVDKFSLPRIIVFIQRYKQLNDSPNADIQS